MQKAFAVVVGFVRVLFCRVVCNRSICFNFFSKILTSYISRDYRIEIMKNKVAENGEHDDAGRQAGCVGRR